jgi:hypothetical protein
MIQDKIFFDEKDPTGVSYNTPFTVYGSYEGRLWSKTPSGTIKYYTQNSDLSVYATTGSNSFNGNQTVTGSLTVTGGIVGTVTTASYVEYTGVANKPTLVSGSEQVSFNGIVDKPTLVSGSSQITYSGISSIPAGIVSSSAQVGGYGIFATTGSNQFNGSQAITGSLTVTGQVVAQTLNVQQVTSSIVFSSGSNIFGNSLSNTQQFTGSVSVTGSLTVTTAGTELQVTSTGVNLGNALTDNHIISGSLRVNPNGLFVSGSGNVGIGTTSPNLRLHVSTTAAEVMRLQGTSGGSTNNTQLRFFGSNANSDLWAIGTEVSTGTTGRAFDFYDLIANANRMRIDASGSVGIGTVTPKGLLDVRVSIDRSVTFTGTLSGESIISSTQGDVTSNLRELRISSRNLYFNTGDATTTGTQRMTLTQDGNVGIGTTDPGARLHISDATSVTRLIVDNTANAAAGAGVYFRTYSSGTLVSNATVRTDNAGNFSVFNGTSSDSENMRIASNGSATFTGPITNNHGALYSQSTLFLNKLVNVGDNTTTTVLTISQDGAYSQIGGGEILIVFVDNGSPWGVYVWKGLISVRTVQFGSMYGTGIQEISSRNNLDGSISVICTTTKTGGVSDAVTRVQITTGSGIAGTAHVSFNGYIQGGSQPV